MKHKDLYVFKRGLDKSNFSFPRITYAITKNKRLVAEAIRDLDKVREPDESFKKFEEEKSVLAEHYAKPNSSGNKINQVPDLLTGEMKGFYNIPDVNDEKSPYRKELAKLEKKYKSEIEKHEDKLKKFNDFLEEESDFKPHMIDFELLEEEYKEFKSNKDLNFDEKKNPFRQEIMDKIYWMINEPKA